jgi:multisubunit Na+/H+ antiporter MnhE subunit
MTNGHSAHTTSAKGLRRALPTAIAWLAFGAWWLLLVDLVTLPELLAGLLVVVGAMIGFELARGQEIAGIALRLRWLARLYRPVLRVPRDIGALAVAAFAQLLRPANPRGRLAAQQFRYGADNPHDTGRRALAQGAGSFSPGSIVIGTDSDSGLILVHRLPARGPLDLDPLDLG